MAASYTIYLGILCIIAILGVGSFKKFTTPFRLLVLSIAYILIHEVVVHNWKALSINTASAYILYAMISPIVVCLVCYLALTSKFARRGVLWIVTALLIIDIFYLAYAPLEPFPSNLIRLSTPCFIFAGLLLLWQSLNSDFATPLGKKSIFVFSLAFINYSVLTFTHLTLYCVVLKTGTAKVLSQEIHTYISCLYYLILGYSLWLDAKQYRRDTN